VSTPGARLFARLVDTRSALLVIVATAVWLAATAGVRPLMLPDEGRYVGIAWEMLTSGDWLVPRLDGLPFFHKPPLFYWLTSLSLGLFGSHQLAARVASLLAATLAAGGMYLFARRYRGSQVATIAVVVLLTQPIFYAAAQFANLDMLVAGLISLAILSGADALLRLEKGNPYHAALARAYGFTRARHPRQGADRHRTACRCAVALAALAPVMALPAGNALAFRVPAPATDRATLVFLDATSVSRILRLFRRLSSFPALLGNGIQQPGGFLVLYSQSFFSAPCPGHPGSRGCSPRPAGPTRTPAACAA
jgi:hypothetical protein